MGMHDTVPDDTSSNVDAAVDLIHVFGHGITIVPFPEVSLL